MKKILDIKILFSFFLLIGSVGLFTQEAQASHLRGVTLSWAPTGNPGEVEFRFLYSQAGVPAVGSVAGVSVNFGDGSGGTATGFVTSVNANDNYFVADTKIRHTYAGVGPYTAFFESCCRISTLRNGRDGTIRMETLVTPRNGNSSPIVSLPPVVTVPVAPNVQFSVPAADANGDRLRYRLATLAESRVPQPAGIGIDANTGLVTWNTSGLNPLPGNLFTAQVIVEDLDAYGNVRSKSPVDFIIKFVASVGALPTLAINPAGPLSVSANSLVTFSVMGSDADVNSRVTLNASGLPSGATMSPAIGAQLSPPVTSTFNWTPTLAQAGPTGNAYVINFTATDDTNQQVLKSITINVLPVGAPTAVGQAISAAAGVSRPVVLQGTDPNGLDLTFSITGLPANGTAVLDGSPSCSLNNGVSTCIQNAIFTANPGYSGPDVFTFRANNGIQNSNAANVSVTVTSNTPPIGVLDVFSTDEDTPLNVGSPGVLSNDTDGENNSLSAVLVEAPLNSSNFALNGDGSFSYSPANNFNGSDSFTYKVNDGTADSNVVTVTINVNAVNDAPSLSGLPATATIDELVSHSFAVTASDIDVPAQTLTFSLVGAPTGASIDSSGGFSWTPTEAQGDGSTYSFAVRVSDGVANTDSPIAITVNEVNSAPALSNIPGPATIPEMAAYTFTAAATDPDLPANTLVFSLVGTVPAGAAIDPVSGFFSWTPAEDQGPFSHSFSVRVSDGAAHTDAPVTLTVDEVNNVPVLAEIADKTVDELVALAGTTAQATDSDLPENTLTYSLTASPAGMTIDPATGAISWTPTEEQGTGDYPVTVAVTDGVAGSQPVTRSFSIHVNEVNVAPELSAIGNSTIDEGSPFTFRASATDADLPANALTYSLVEAPEGASIDPASGVFTWTPTEAQGGNPNTPYTFTVKVTDSGVEAMSDEQSVTLTVREVNSAPVLAAIGNQSNPWGTSFAFNASATDADLPANELTFTLTGTVPAGASMTNDGAFSWIPGSGQIGLHKFNVLVTDNGTPSKSDTKSFTVLVGKRPTTLVYNGDLAEQYSDQTALSATLTDTLSTAGLPGKSIVFAIGTQATSGVTDGAGSAGGSLTLTQNPAPAYSVASSFAGDEHYLAASDSDTFDITQEDARAYYTGTLFVNTSCATCSAGTVTLSATIKDITAETGDPAHDALEGDIRNSTVTFINRDNNTVIAANVPVGLVNPGDTKTGTAVFNWNVNIGSNDSLDYTIGIIVNNYYTRNASEDDVIVTVSKPLGTNFITGGGYIVLTDSAGQYAGLDGKKANFGFNVKYNNAGTNLKGRLNVIVRGSGGRVYQIKGNVMRTLAVATVSNNPPVKSAVFTGKANLTDITDPLNPIALGGNNTLQMTMTDNGEPGSTDTIGISLLNDAGGVLFASNWDGTRTIEQLLGGGNLVVR